MADSYKKLFHLLIERNMTTSQFQKQARFLANIIAHLKHNGAVFGDAIECLSAYPLYAWLVAAHT